MRTDIKLTGVGGQGIMSAGRILGVAAINDGLSAIQTETYGPEARGAPVYSDVVISDGEIHLPFIIEPDILVVMSQFAFDKFCTDLPKDCILILDSELVDKKGTAANNVIYEAPFASIADKVGRRMVANVVMLGALVAISGVVSKDSLREAILKHVPSKAKDLNERALETGIVAGKEAKSEKED